MLVRLWCSSIIVGKWWHSSDEKTQSWGARSSPDDADDFTSAWSSEHTDSAVGGWAEFWVMRAPGIGFDLSFFSVHLWHWGVVLKRAEYCFNGDDTTKNMLIWCSQTFTCGRFTIIIKWQWRAARIHLQESVHQWTFLWTGVSSATWSLLITSLFGLRWTNRWLRPPTAPTGIIYLWHTGECTGHHPKDN